MRYASGIGVLALALMSGPVVTAAAVPAAQADWETSEVADGVYQFRYGGHYNVFFVTQDGIVAFDPLSVEAAEIYAQEIQRLAPGLPLLAIIYSHSHDDHATGAAVLQAAFGAVPIVAHANAVAPIRLAADPDLPPPTITFTDRMTLHYGGRTLDLYYLGKSHTDNMLVALLREEKIAYAVDFVTNGTMPYRDLYAHEFPDFFDTLGRLHELSYETMLFAHDPPGDRQSIEDQIVYYDALRNAVQQAIAAGESEDEAAATVRLPQYESWGRYEEFLPLNVRGMYRWLASQRLPGVLPTPSDPPYDPSSRLR